MAVFSARQSRMHAPDPESMTYRSGCTLGTRSPHIDACEQKQPDHVHEVPIPGSELETEMLGRREMAEIDADQAHDQKGRTDNHVRAVETGRHEKRRPIDVAAEMEACVAVLVGLHTGESEAKGNGQDQPPFEALTVVLQERV